MEELLVKFAQGAKMLSEAAAVIVVTFGSLEAFVMLLRMAARPNTTHGARKAVWRRFGMWLLLGLEFELAADIIGSVVSPPWQDILELAASPYRTSNYFLTRSRTQIAPRTSRIPARC